MGESRGKIYWHTFGALEIGPPKNSRACRARTKIALCRPMVARAPLHNALMFRSDPLRLLSGFAGDGRKISCIDLPPRSRVHLVNDPDLVAELLLEKSKKLHKHLFP